MLLELEGAAGEGDVVIGGEQGNQAEHKAAQGLEDAKAIEAGADSTACGRAPVAPCPSAAKSDSHAP